MVFYIGVGGYNRAQAIEIFNTARNYFESLRDESVAFIFAPDFETRSCRVEAINPKRISDEEYEKVSEIVKDYDNRLKKFDERRIRL